MNTYIRVIVIINFLIMVMMGKTHAQESEPNMLFNTWFLDTYKIENKEYPPSKREKDDYILFKQEMTYTSKSEGKEEKGSFTLNTSGAYILMIDEKGYKIKVYIISISQKSLILKYDINEMRDIEVHYNNSNK